ncbi:MAG: M1 family aminopeptidase, partial [bacterium]
YPLPSLDQIFRNLARLYMESGQDEPISKEIYKYNDPISTIFNLYLKSAIFYEMLRFVVGNSVFKASMREVVRRHAFTHVKESDLLAVFEDVSGQDLSWFFEQWLHRTPTVDYSKGKIKKYKRDDKIWVTEVEVKRRGDGIMPVDVELDLGGGKKVIKRWHGKETSGTIVFETAEKPKSVKLDPEDRIMDSNRLNNQRPRLEFRPDLPLLKYIHMPGDAILVLWRPVIGYNKHDSIRLGFRTQSSYRAFYHNLTLEAMFGFKSKELDGKITYSNPIGRKSLLSRYQIMARKNEGRFEADVHLVFNGSGGILSTSGRSLEAGFNFSGLLNSAYTFRRVANDTGKVRFDEWEDLDILLAYLGGRARFGLGKLDSEMRFRVEMALPGGAVQFTKISARLEAEYQNFGFKGQVRGNLATSLGPDRLPLQDQFHAEGAGARERFQNDLVKTGDALSSFSHRYVEGGGFLRGYAGLPLPAERYTTLNVQLEPNKLFFIFRVFGFYDTGRIWRLRDGKSITRSDAGFGISFLGKKSPFFGGNLALFSNFSAKLFFPIWLSDPPAGEKEVQFRWYLSLGKSL